MGNREGGQAHGLSDEVIISLVLLGTLKNYGIAGGIALALFSREAAMPSTISAVVMILYIVWLEYRKRWPLPGPVNSSPSPPPRTRCAPLKRRFKTAVVRDTERLSHVS